MKTFRFRTMIKKTMFGKISTSNFFFPETGNDENCVLLCELKNSHLGSGMGCTGKLNTKTVTNTHRPLKNVLGMNR